MFDTSFERLLWKEYRQHRPLWLALLIATPLIQAALVFLIWWGDGFRQELFFTVQHFADGLMSAGFAATVVYLLGCCATMFSVEHETGAFHFQRLLPANSWRVFWAKVVFAVVSTMVLALLLWIITRGPLLIADAKPQVTWFGRFGLLYMVEVLLWGVLVSMLLRWPLWSVILAITAQTLVLQWMLPFLAGERLFGATYAMTNPGTDARYLFGRIVLDVVLVIVDLVVGQLWFEERLRRPKWPWGRASDRVETYLSGLELPAYSGRHQTGWSRLVGLAWRDTRWVIGGVLLLFVCCWRVSPTDEERFWIMLVYYFGSLVFGLCAFASDQWNGRYRFHAEHGVSPRLVWLSRHVVCLPPVLLMMAGVIWLCLKNPQVFAPHPFQRTFEWAAAIVGPFVCYAAGQFTAMSARNAAIGFAAGLGLTVCGIFWSLLSSALLGRAFWPIAAWPVIGMFVTWFKAKDWIEERRDRAARWRTALAIVAPTMLLLVACATYRVTQIPVVTLPVAWDEPRELLARMTPAERESLALYRRALLEIEQREAGVETYEARIMRGKQEHPDWTDTQNHSAAFNGFHNEWTQAAPAAVPLLHAGHSLPAVPIALIADDLPPNPSSWNPNRVEKLPFLMERAAERSLKSGNLDETWKHIEVSFELLRRLSLRSATPQQPYYSKIVSGSEAQLLHVVAEWGRHPQQTQARIVTAIRFLEQLEAQPEAALRDIHWQLRFAETMLTFDAESKKYARVHGGPDSFWWRDDESTWVWLARTAMPWEIWRSHRVIRWESSLALRSAEILQQMLKQNRPLPVSWSDAKEHQQLLANSGLSQEGLDGLLQLSNYNPNSSVGMVVETTILPPNMAYFSGLSSAMGSVRRRSEEIRATILQLALADFRREHAKLPNQLSELRPTYFAEIPRNPQSSEFVYFPDGPAEDVMTDSLGQTPPRVLLRKGVPFLWSPGQYSYGPNRGDGPNVFRDSLGKVVPINQALSQTHYWPLIAESP